jgi:hypothetical protein
MLATIQFAMADPKVPVVLRCRLCNKPFDKRESNSFTIPGFSIAHVYDTKK